MRITGNTVLITGGATGISSIMTPSVIDWHNRILSVQIRSGVSSLVTCSGGQMLDTLQPGQDLFEWTLSQYGLAYVLRPQNLFVHPAGDGSRRYAPSCIAGCPEKAKKRTGAYSWRRDEQAGYPRSFLWLSLSLLLLLRRSLLQETSCHLN